MLDILQTLVQQASQQAVVQNPAVPNERNNDVMQTITSTLMSGLGSQLASPQGVSQLAGLFKGGGQAAAGNPMVNALAQNAVGALAEKFGLNPSVANGIVQSVLPMVMDQLVSKVNDPNDASINMEGLVQGLAGNQGGMDVAGIMGSVSNAMADGKLDMQDVMNIAGQATKGGGLGSMLGGLFGKK